MPPFPDELLTCHDFMNIHPHLHRGHGRIGLVARRRLRTLSRNGLLAMAVVALTGCGGGKIGKKQENFFTSGSREADQRASQNMAKAEQLAGTGEGAGEKGVKKAKPGESASGDTKAA